MQGFPFDDYEIRLFGATVHQCFDLMDALKPFVRTYDPLPHAERLLECHSEDESLFTYLIIQNAP